MLNTAYLNSKTISKNYVQVIPVNGGIVALVYSPSILRTVSLDSFGSYFDQPMCKIEQSQKVRLETESTASLMGGSSSTRQTLLPSRRSHLDEVTEN